ncbi:MAG TPA: glycosyltransferase [archaeon]|nr:glycosyltransferase [archaeon]
MADFESQACTPPSVSVVIPMYNEGENVRGTVLAVCDQLRRTGRTFELVCVDDGSTDTTREELDKIAREIEEVRVIGYKANCGRGKALREGFSASRGLFIISIDADLSYHPGQIISLVERLEKPDDPDIIIASPYMPGGKTEGVKPFRLLVSRAANILLRQAMGRKYYTLTGIFRGYRRKVFDCIELYSDGKEIHLEIIAKAEAAGLQIVEVPAVLTSRSRGGSKLKMRLTVVSHLMFSFYERPLLLFGVLGLLFTLASLVLGGYLFYLYWTSALNPTRPIVWLSVLLLLTGIQMASFAFISTQITLLKKELFRTQKEVLLLQRTLEKEKRS